MSLLKNSTIVVAGVVISNALAYAFHFVAGRMLGPEKYGEFGALMALFSLVALPAPALSSAITKFTSLYHSENKYNKIAGLRNRMQRDILIYSFALILIFIILSIPIANYFHIDSVVPVICVGISLLFSFLLSLNMAILQGLKKFEVISWNGIIESFSRLLLLTLFLFIGGGVSASVMSYGLAYFIAFLVIFPKIKEVSNSKIEGVQLDIKSIYRFGIQVLFVNIVLQAMTNLPSLFIKHYYSNEFNGYWTAALNLARISQFVTGAVSMVMFPEIVAEKNYKHRKRIFLKSVFIVLLSSLAVTFLLFLMPKFLIQSLYGAQFIGAAPLLGWMGLAMTFIGYIQLWLNYKLAKVE